MQVLTTISSYLTMSLGIGVLLIGIYYVWGYVFEKALTVFHIHDLFRQFIFDSYRKNRQVYTPNIDEESLKKRLTKDK
jgi:hypothetical protein